MAAETLNERTRVGMPAATLLGLALFTAGSVSSYYNSRDGILREARAERDQALQAYPTRLELERSLVLQSGQIEGELKGLRQELVSLRIAIEGLKRR